MIVNHLGLAYRARKITVGTAITIERLRSNEVVTGHIGNGCFTTNKKKDL
jgi:hypothetical protein